MAMQDPAGGGRLVVIDTSTFASDAVVYTVSDGKTFVGFLQSGTVNAASPYKVNGIGQTLPVVATNGVGFTPLPVTWPAGTVVSKSGAASFYIQGNEL